MGVCERRSKKISFAIDIKITTFHKDIQNETKTTYKT